MSVFGVIAVETTALLAATALWVAPAQAERFAGADPSGDMVTESADGIVVAAHHHNLDIRTVVIRHRAHRLTIRVKYEELRMTRHREAVLMGFLRTNRSAMPYSNLRDGPYQWEVRFTRRWRHRPEMIGILDAENEEDWNCFASFGSPLEGMRARINYRKNFIFASYPRRCIRPFHGPSGIRPKWIRASVSSFGDGYFDHWIKPNDITWPYWPKAFYATPRLYPGTRQRRAAHTPDSHRAADEAKRADERVMRWRSS
jgi:hypothetical protein